MHHLIVTFHIFFPQSPPLCVALQITTVQAVALMQCHVFREPVKITVVKQLGMLGNYTLVSLALKAALLAGGRYCCTCFPLGTGFHKHVALGTTWHVYTNICMK